MMKIRYMTALLLGAVMPFGAVPAATGTEPAAAADTTPLVTTGPTFNDPTDPERQNAVFGHLSHLIDGAVPGSDIKVSLYVLGSDWLAGRLVSAHERGVNVQVILDDRSLKHYAGQGAYARLADGLSRRTGTSGTSWVRVCQENTACLAKDPNPQDGFHNVNHNKFLLFSRTTGNAAGTVPVDDVVVQTSANQTAWDRQRAWNDAMTVAENPALYAAYAGYFADLAAAQADPSKQVSDYAKSYEAGRAKVYFFPRSESDVILNILHTVDNPVDGRPVCHGNSPGYGTADGRTVIRVAMHQITRIEVAKKLWELDDAGCYVDIVHRLLDNSGTAVADQLTKPTRYGGITMHRLNDDAEGNTATHSKYLLIDGTYLGRADRKIVFTGSHPYTYSGLTANDEALLKYQDDAVHDAYRENFRRQRAVADRQSAQ